VLQRFFAQFPTQINRENILKIREFLSDNSEFFFLTEVTHMPACDMQDGSAGT
jgi:hypothetical protein